ncbi:MAG: VOC family protein [Pseudomonadota bacterium]
MTDTALLGPLIHTADPATWDRLLTQVFGLERLAEQAFAPDEMTSLWGVPATPGALRHYRTPGTAASIFVLTLDGAAAAPEIRDPASGYDADALKVIDFYTPDFERAQARLAQAGFALKGDLADYELPAGPIREGHLWGPDGVVCALIGGAKAFLEDFVSVTDAPFSEVMSVSAPVSDQPAVLAFYQSLGFRELYRYGVDSESFQRLVGADRPIRISAVNMGSHNAQPYVGTIDYALPPAHFRSLRDDAQLPRRGLAGLVIEVPDLSGALATLAAAGYSSAEGPAAVDLAGLGLRSWARVTAPHGVEHYLIARRR